MTRTYLPGILAMAAIVVASNILVQFLFGQWLTWGAFTYPLAFLVTDVMNRVYGKDAARRVVLVGFVVGLVCSLIGTQIMGEFGPLVTLRIAIGSGVAFLVAQLVDVAIFFSGALSFLHPATDVSWAAEMLPLLGSGPLAPLWVSLAVADWSVKLGIALIALIPFRIITAQLLTRS